MKPQLVPDLAHKELTIKNIERALDKFFDRRLGLLVTRVHTGWVFLVDNKKDSVNMKRKGYKVAASVTVYRISDMTKKGRREICAWLYKLADDIQAEPDSFAKTFRARYHYSP